MDNDTDLNPGGQEQEEQEFAEEPRQRKNDGDGEAGDKSGDEEEGEGEEEEPPGSSIADSSEEEEDEEGNEYEVDGFVVDEEEDDEEDAEGEAGEGAKKKKKHRKKKRLRKVHDLDEEDYNLLEDQGIRVQRPTGRKRLKRVQEAGRGGPGQDAAALRNELFGNEDLEDVLEDDEDFDDGGPRGAGPGRRSRDDMPGGGRRGRDDRDMDHEAADDDFGDGDEMDDFIVDEGPGGAARARRRKQALAASIPGISAAALEEAAEIFGDVDELLAVYNDTRRVPGQEDELDLEILPDEGEEEEEDEEAAQRKAEQREQAAQRNVLRKAMRLLDAETLASQHLLPGDQLIREKDVPERFQLLGIIQDDKEPLDIAACANWIYWVVFVADDEQGKCARAVAHIVEDGLMEVDTTMPSPLPDGWPREALLSAHDELAGIHGRGDRSPMHTDGVLHLGSRRAIRKARSKDDKYAYRRDPVAQERLKSCIQQALIGMYEKSEEPLLQGLYRKEQLGDLIAMRNEDAPQVTSQADLDERLNAFHGSERATAYDLQTVMPRHRRIRRFDALYAIMWLSLRFRKLWKRRSQLLAKLEALVQSLTEAGDTDQALALQTIQDWLTNQLADITSAPVQPACCLLESHLDDLDAALRSTQDVHGLEVDMASLSLEGGSQQGNGRGARAGRAGGTAGGAGASTAMFRKLHAAGVTQLMRQALLSAGQFAENLQDPDSMPHQCEEPDGPATQKPHEWLESMASSLPLETHGITAVKGVDLLPRVKAMAVHELATEPRVRTWLRNYFFRSAVVNTQPTHTGQDHPLLEPYAKYGRVKHYKNKPVDTFADSDNFLRILEATRERLLTFTLELPENREQEMLAQLSKLYQSVNKSAKAQVWNELRQEIVVAAVKERLIPVVKADIRQRMLVAAKEVAQEEYAAAFWKLARTAPLRLRLDTEEDHMGEVYLTAPRIMACCWGPGGTQPTVVVALNEQGGLVDLLPCGQLSGNIPRSMRGAGSGNEGGAITDPRKSTDMSRLLEKIMERRPHALVVGMSDPSAGQLMTDLTALMDHLLDVHARFVQQLETSNIELLPADERLAALWQDCKAAKDEFPEQPPHVRRAIALGRLQIDPLPVLAALCGPRQEVLSLSLTDMQGALQEQERMRLVEQTMVTATAQVGVDVNLAANVGWHRHLLQFVPGLGPRKAQALLQAVARNSNRIESRNFMYKELGDVLGRCVFRNCGGVLRLTSAGLPHLSNLELRQLDDSRIHPESYRHAVALCTKATGEDDVEAAVDEHKDQIELVDLVALSHEKEGLSSRLATLIDIQMELLMPYGELRPPTKPLTEKECYLLQHGESEASLCPGRLVEARVVFIGRDEVKVRLTHCSMDGVIRREDLSSNRDWLHGDLRDKIRKDQVLTCRVLGINDSYSRPGTSAKQVVVVLSSKGDDMDPAKWEREYCQEHLNEPHYVVPTAEERAEAAARAERAARGTPTRAVTPTRTQREANRGPEQIVPRAINHPLYQPISTKDAVSQLVASDKPVGACIIRPTNRHTGLWLSIKVHASSDGTAHIMHFKIIESQARGGRGGASTLSTPIKVDLQQGGIKPNDPECAEYEDLDELHDAFVQPMVARVNQLIKHRKFEDLNRNDLDNKVLSEFQASNKKNIPYYLSIHTTVKGDLQFCITFAVPSSSLAEGCKKVHEYFYITPGGFYFRKHTYPDIEKMVAVFKTTPISKERQQEQSNLGYAPPSSMPNTLAPSMIHNRGPMGGFGMMPQQAYGHPPPPPQYGGYGSYPSQQGGYGYQSGPPPQAYGAPRPYGSGPGGPPRNSKWDQQGGPAGLPPPAGAYGNNYPPRQPPYGSNNVYG